MAPSMVVLLNTPLILLPMRLIPKDSPLFDVFLHMNREDTEQWLMRENHVVSVKFMQLQKTDGKGGAEKKKQRSSFKKATSLR